MWKTEDPKVLLEEIQKKKDEKLRIEEEKKKKKEAETKKKSTHPSAYFKEYFGDKYSKFDDNGLPSHDLKGEELNDKTKKKL